MRPVVRFLIVAALGAVLAVAVAVKKSRPSAGAAEAGRAPAVAAAAAGARLPRLLDLGAGKCIPCKAMAPILEELKKDYAAVFTTEFIDVWKDEEAGKKYGVEMIPTQLFFDAAGRELFRHTGFYGREDILGKWKELGVDVGARP